MNVPSAAWSHSRALAREVGSEGRSLVDASYFSTMYLLVVSVCQLIDLLSTFSTLRVSCMCHSWSLSSLLEL